MEQQGKAALDRGTKLGQYKIERLMGVGSMGAVYEGVHSETGKRFAIKVLSPVLAAVPTARARFLKEATLTAGLRHAHVVDVTDVGEDAGHSYFVMELLEGEDLSHRLRRSGALSAAEAADILRPVCNAVAEAHRRGITHGDLKPSNIFLAIRERRLHPVVLDFGIAKDGEGASPGDAAGAVSAPGAVLGTPFYLAPEQVADHRAASAASDQHALGAILYECLTGKPPYGGDNLEEVFRAIVAGNPAPPSTRRPDVPQSMDAIVRRALNSDPKRRFASVGELGLALYPFASKPAGPTPEPYRRPPTSPAIDVEASTRSPFERTLTPEVEALDSAWFEAGESPQEIEAEQAIDLEPLPTHPPEASETAAKGRGKRAPRRLGIGAAGGVVFKRLRIGAAGGVVFKRLWIGAAGGVVCAALALVLVATRGSASPPPRPQAIPTPAQALVQNAPVAEEPPVEPMPDPAVVRPPARAPSERPAPVPSAELTPTPAAPAPSKALAAPAPTPAPSEMPTPAPSEPPARAPSAELTPTPAALAPTAAAPTPAAPSKALTAAVPTPAVPAPSKALTAAPTPAAPAPSKALTAAAPTPAVPAPSKALTAAAPTPAPSERPTRAPSERPTRAPSERPTRAPSELAASAAAAAPSEPAAPGDVSAAEGKPRVRKAADRPRARGGAVRMHNGVPLLD